MKILIAFLFISSVAFGQKDSTAKKDSVAKLQTIQIISDVQNDMKAALYGKVGREYYEVIDQLFLEYINEKKRLWNIKNNKP